MTLLAAHLLGYRRITFVVVRKGKTGLALLCSICGLDGSANTLQSLRNGSDFFLSQINSVSQQRQLLFTKINIFFTSNKLSDTPKLSRASLEILMCSWRQFVYLLISDAFDAPSLFCEKFNPFKITSVSHFCVWIPNYNHFIRNCFFFHRIFYLASNRRWSSKVFQNYRKRLILSCIQRCLQ